MILDKFIYGNEKNIESWDKPTSLVVYLRKDGKHFDMRFKDTRVFVKAGQSSKFSKFMQKVANTLGCPHGEGMMATLGWYHYLNPIKFIRHLFTGVWYLN